MSKKVGVFCGANKGNSEIIIKQAEELCNLLISYDYDLVYGGGVAGLMGLIANKFLENGKKVIGISPKKFIIDEDVHKGLTELIITKDMAERKTKLFELSDVFIALPGGIGTLDEIIETYTLHKIGFTNKRSGILNSDNYYKGLEHLLKNMVDKEFLKESSRLDLAMASSPTELLKQLNIAP